jgi:hypothetical protein
VASGPSSRETLRVFEKHDRKSRHPLKQSICKIMTPKNCPHMGTGREEEYVMRTHRTLDIWKLVNDHQQ